MLRKIRVIICSLAIVAALVASPNARASQGSGCMPTTGIVSGLAFAQNINAAIAALISSNSGGSAPATDCSSAAVKGQVWLDTSATPNILKQYDGTNWVIVGYLDSTNSVWTPPVGGGAATIASASTTDLWSVAPAAVTVSGTTTITAFANASAVPGTMKIVKFASVLTLTHNATSLVLPGGENLTTAAGDYALVVATSDTNVAVASYFKADGTAVTNPAVPIGTKLDYTGFSAPEKFVFGYGQALTRTSYPEYVSAVTRTQSAVRVSGSSTLTSVSDTSQFGAGMPIEGTGIPSGTTISSVTSTTIVMSQNASSSGTNDVTVFAHGYGAGGSSSTVGVVDCRGRPTYARDDMGGTAASRLTPSMGMNGSQLGATSSNQPTFQIAKTNLPNTTITVTGTFSGSATVNSLATDVLRNPAGFQSDGSSGPGFSGSGASGYTITSTGSTSGTISGTTAALGDGTAISRIGQGLVTNCIVRVER